MKFLKAFLKDNYGFITFVFLLFACRSSIADWYHVPSGSMLPNILIGDRILVDKMAYRVDIPFTDIAIIETGTPSRGDIVTFNSEAADNRLIKRIVGLPGDTVGMLNNRLLINGEAIEYQINENQVTENLPGLSHTVKWSDEPSELSSFYPIEVPQGHYLVLGDNRDLSADSRVYGFIPLHEISGKATHVIVSLDQDDYYLPRSSRWFKGLN